MKPIVWAIKEQVVRDSTAFRAMDYSPAAAYGELKFITRADIPFHDNSSVRDVWNDDIAKFVAAYNEETDFIIATGQPTAIFAIGCALGAARKNPRFLVWRREDNHYRLLTVKLWEMSHG